VTLEQSRSWVLLLTLELYLTGDTQSQQQPRRALQPPFPSNTRRMRPAGPLTSSCGAPLSFEDVPPSLNPKVRHGWRLAAALRRLRFPTAAALKPPPLEPTAAAGGAATGLWGAAWGCALRPGPSVGLEYRGARSCGRGRGGCHGRCQHLIQPGRRRRRSQAGDHDADALYARKQDAPERGGPARRCQAVAQLRR